MKRLIILTGILFSISGGAEIWEPPPYQPDENHLPPEEQQKQEEEKSPEEEKKVKQDKENSTKDELPGRPLFPIK